jgi:hypothetical protein
MRTTMAGSASSCGDVEAADDEHVHARGNPRQRRDHHRNRETAIDRETRVLIRGSSRNAGGETTPTRDRVRL